MSEDQKEARMSGQKRVVGKSKQMLVDVTSLRALRVMGGWVLGFILRVVGRYRRLLNRRMAWSDLHIKEMTEVSA